VTVSVSASGSGLIQKAFIFVPAVPKAPESNRTMGPGARLVLLAHEFLHAMGAKHSTDDIMQDKSQLQLGATYVEDRVWIMTPAGPRLMPPLFISGTTTDAIRTVWTPA
jgi:hypothetical protein